LTEPAAELTTARLTLREPADDDAPLLLAYHVRNHERLERWDPPRGTELEQHRRWLAWRSAEREAGRGRTWLAFDAASPGALVGEVELDAISTQPERTAMVAYSVDAAYEGKGYASEAVGAVVAFAFGTLGLETLSATFHPANDRSGALLRRLGFVEMMRTEAVPGFERHMRAQVLARLVRPR
jgi:[ribosomal protein S5]-alanine N-acetyltransferase